MSESDVESDGDQSPRSFRTSLKVAINLATFILRRSPGSDPI